RFLVASARVALHELPDERRGGRRKRLRVRLEVRPILEAEAVGPAFSGAKEGDHLRHLLAGTDAGRDVPAASREIPVLVALLIAGGDRDHVGRVFRAAGGAARDCIREAHIVEAGHRLRLARSIADAISATSWLCERRKEPA